MYILLIGVEKIKIQKYFLIFKGFRTPQSETYYSCTGATEDEPKVGDFFVSNIYLFCSLPPLPVLPPLEATEILWMSFDVLKC